MLDSDQIFDLIERAAADSSRTGKEKIVAEIVADPLGKRALVAALDPFTTYGIAKVPEYSPIGDRVFERNTWDLLVALGKRELTGNAARDWVRVHLQALTPKSADLLKRIITKDLRAGFGADAVNKAAKGLIKEFPYMRCSLPKDAKLAEFDWATGVFSQEKADGMFANIDVTLEEEVRISSRQGTLFPLDGGLQTLAYRALDTFQPGTQTHGELLVFFGDDPLPREQSNGVLNSIAQGGELPEDLSVVFLAWDQIPLTAVVPKGKYHAPYSERFAALAKQIGKSNANEIGLIPTLCVTSLAKAYEHYRALLAEGKEGTIIKHPHAIWKDGTSREQVKLKLEVDVDLRAVGLVPGTGKNADTFGSIRFETSDRKLVVDVSGFSDKARKELAARWHEVVGRIGTVRANSIMAPSESSNVYSLFLPRIVEFPRTDKNEADSLARVKAQFESAVRAA